MATEAKWEAPAAIQTYLTTELNALADDGKKLGAKIDNGADGENEMYINLELKLATQTARDAGATVDVYILASVDDTNFNYGGDSQAPPASAYVGSFPLDAAVTGHYATLENIPLPPLDFKILLINSTGQAFGATANTLKYRIHSLESQ